MLRLITLLVLVLAGCVVRERTVIRTDAPPPPVTVSVDRFEPYLSPYGTWVTVARFGRAWQPSVQFVGPDFYPYGTGGRWVYTDAGWVFDSDYPFSWAVFHYGRWMVDPFHGWVWVPGNTWAPAWVSWRTGGTYVGWAPLGPLGAPEFHHRHWLFVDTGHFTVVNVHAHAVPEHRFHHAVAVTGPVHGAVPVGPPPAYITATTRTRVVPVPVNEVRSSGRTVPPPPPPGRVTASVPPPPSAQPSPPPPPPPTERGEPERLAPPPARMDPPAPPPARLEPERRPPLPPPARVEPERRSPLPPPARVEPERRAPLPPPARVEPQRPTRFSPPPAMIAPAPPPGSPGVAQPPPPTKKKTPAAPTSPGKKNLGPGRPAPPPPGP